MKRKHRNPKMKRKHANFNIKLYFKVFFVSLLIIIGTFFAAMACGFFGPAPSDENIDGEITEDMVEPVDKATGKVNVLMLGVDKDGLRTDTIIVLSYNLDDDKINVLSIPRDTRMYIGSRYQKINAAHAISQSGKIKGPQGSIEAVTRLTGIPINYYVEFSFSTFRDTVDALDGVYFDVPRDMFYEDPAQNLYINLKQGYQLLNGDKAEQLVRFRRYPEGDIARVQMQQNFLKAVFEQKLNAEIIKKIPELYKRLSENITTNATLVDIVKYVPNLSDLKTENINMYQLPGGFNDTDYGASYWVCDIDDTKTMIQTIFGYDASGITIHSADGKSVSKDKAVATAAPKATAKPKATQTPTPAPAVTPTPAPQTQTPAATPKATAKPKAKAKATAKPKVTQSPTATAVQTSMPDSDVKAVATAAPAAAVTASPKVTSTPKVTHQPEATVKAETTPKATAKTQVTAQPAAATVSQSEGEE